MHITGKKKPKPFECVGTYEELLAGLRLSIKKLEAESKPLPYLLKYAKEKILARSQSLGLLTAWDENNFLTKEVSRNLKAQIL